MARHDFSGSCKEEVKSCLEKAAIRKGGTARAPKAGKRIDWRDFRRRTVVVWMLTLLVAVVMVCAFGLLGSGR